MKRKALLIGNTHGLAGIQIDIKKTRAFLLSDVGGGWLDSEIDVLTNPRRDDLLAQVDKVRHSSPDYVFLLFSGHGGLEKRTTVLVLNDIEETITEDVLFEIAPRQISVFDCCRALEQEHVVEAFTAADRLMKFAKASTVRERFDARIMQSIPQHVRLYSCSMGQVSSDTSNGAIYLQNLLNSAKSLNYNEIFKTAEQAHLEAATATAARKDGQIAEAILPKCLSSQRLILSVRP